MAILNILKTPDYKLKLVSSPVEKVTQDVQHLVTNMFQTLYAFGGIGLSAPQVNVQKRIIILNQFYCLNSPLVFIDPLILERNGDIRLTEECLSIPQFSIKVSRARTVKVFAQDFHGKFFECVLDDLLAVVVQHEIDHLDGKLITDYR